MQLELQKESKNMQAFGLTKMQLLKIILLLSVFVLSSVLATGMLCWGIFFLYLFLDAFSQILI